MPIKAENRGRYPANWKQLRAAVLERAGNCCEGSPAYPHCRVPNYAYRGPDGGWTMDEYAAIDKYGDEKVTLIVLTVAHLEHDDLETQDINRLRAWCQKCHLTYDAKHHAQNAAQTRRKGNAIGELFP